MKTQHTPIPWLFDNDDILSVSDGLVATMTDDDGVPLNEHYRADAELIVRAVNSFDELLRAAKFARNVIDGACGQLTSDEIKRIFRMMSRAINKAEGK